MSLSFRIYKALCLKQIAISSLLYCNILTQGPSSSFFFYFIVIRMISQFTEVNLQFIFINITSLPGFPVSQVSHQGPTLESHVRAQLQGPTLGFHLRASPCPTLGSHLRGPPYDLTLRSHLRVPPKDPVSRVPPWGPGSHFSSMPQNQ